MPASSRRGRVTPKGVRPPGVKGRRPDTTLRRDVVRGGKSAMPRQPVAKTPIVRTGHRAR